MTETPNILSWEDVSFSVETPNQGRLQILHGITGYAVGGRLLAIMGASGSGKTTLLDILCNRKRMGSYLSEDVRGAVLANGQLRRASHTPLSYVPQHDTLLNTATIRETFEMAAQLRIAGITPNELKVRVDGVLEDLGLTHREHSLVGGGEIRGLSGGERRRVSIGQEIVSSQNTVLMLDEPTTGLDSTTAESVMTCLRDLARLKGMVIVATIHQPNSTITALFDDFMLMGKGHCLYLGPFSEAVTRFSNVGFPCPLYCNPVDYFIGVGADVANIPTLSGSNKQWVDDERKKPQSLAQIGFHRIPNTKVKSNKSSFFSSKNVTTGTDGAAASDGVSLLLQVKLLVIRHSRQWFRDPGMLVSELFQYIFFAIFLGGMYYNIDLDIEGGVYNRTASLFFILTILVFTPPFTTIFTFANERPLFLKERGDNMYSSAAWLLAKSIVLVPIESMLCLVFSSIMYFMVGYQDKADKFFLFFTILALFQLIGESIGLVFAVLSKSPTFAVVWLSLFLVIMLSLTGFLTYEMPVFYLWIHDSNVMRFAMLGLILNEFSGLEFDTGGGVKVDGLDALPDSVSPDSDISVGGYIGILVGFLVGLRLLILVILWTDSFPKWASIISAWYEERVGAAKSQISSAIPQDDIDDVDPEMAKDTAGLDAGGASAASSNAEYEGGSVELVAKSPAAVAVSV